MELRVKREIFTDKSTIGRLFLDGEFQCYTLEPQWREDDVKPRAIPQGSYEVTYRFSDVHKRFVPHVENVPGFVGIEIHIGNFPHDTEGCLLVAERYDANKPDFISESSPAFYELVQKLMPAWDNNETVTITYINGLH